MYVTEFFGVEKGSNITGIHGNVFLINLVKFFAQKSIRNMNAFFRQRTNKLLNDF